MSYDSLAIIKQTFFQECEEQLIALESGLTDIEAGESDPEIVNAVFRAVHSIKGGAAAFHFEELIRFAHVFETTLDLFRTGDIAKSPENLKTMLRASDTLADLVRATRDGTAIAFHFCVAAVEELANLNSGVLQTTSDAAEDDEQFFQPVEIDFANLGPASAATPDLCFRIDFRPDAALYQKANEPAVLIRELESLGTLTVECDDSALPLLNELEPESAYLRWTLSLRTQVTKETVREIFEFVDQDCELSITEETAGVSGRRGSVTADLLENVVPLKTSISETPAEQIHVDESRRNSSTPPTVTGSPLQTTIRVEVDRVDRLVNLIGELVINQSMLSQRVADSEVAVRTKFVTSLNELGSLTREIQESVMAIRAQPVKPVFQRMARVVRETAEMTGKRVILLTDGEATEVDKTVIECLADPLTHMIRNAIDHGIETPAEREAAGKPPEGTIKLSAYHRSGRIIIEVSDDGAGINRVRVRDIAIRKGLIAQDASMSDEEIDALIFHPGFSTADVISNVSGRGVGMDVVKRSIQALGGRINITSAPSRGSTFTLSLPLTLAVLDGMIVTVAGQTLVLPLTAIVETLKPKAANIHGFGSDSYIISVRDSLTPVIDIGLVLGYRATAENPLNCVVILIESDVGGRRALLVDAIQDQRQIVVKSLEANYGAIPGIAAATILGDGRVALILDVDSAFAPTGHAVKQHLDSSKAA